MVHFSVSDTWQATKCTVLVLVLSKESQTFITCKFQLPFAFWLAISCLFAVVVVVVVVVYTIVWVNVPGRSVALFVYLTAFICLSVHLSFVRPPHWWSREPHQHGGLILGSVNVRNTFRRISKSLGKRRDLILGEVFSLLISSDITISWLITVFVDTWLSKTKHPRKRFQNFRQSYMLSTDGIETHQSQPAGMT